MAVIRRKKWWFRTARVIFDDAFLMDESNKERFAFIEGVSYHILTLSGFTVRTKETSVIDLTKEEDELFRAFSDTTRNEIRRTERTIDFSAVSAGPVSDQSYALYRTFEQQKGRRPVPRDRIGNALFFGATYAGRDVAGVYVYAAQPYLRIRSIFSARLDTDEKEMQKVISNASRRLIWDVCRWGKAHGFKALDLASVNTTRPETASIARFKLSFGGPIVTEYTYTYRTPLFALFERLARVRDRLLRLLHQHV